MKNLRENKAYVALSSVLVIAVLIISISISITLLSISEGQMSLSDELKLKSRNLVESCVGEALLELAETQTLPAMTLLQDGVCQISNINNNVNIWSFEITGDFEGYSSTFAVQASLDEIEQDISIISWKEI